MLKTLGPHKVFHFICDELRCDNKLNTRMNDKELACAMARAKGWRTPRNYNNKWMNTCPNCVRLWANRQIERRKLEKGNSVYN